MRHGSLFSGIGGFDLAAQWMGWENVFQVEWDKWCQKVLEKNFPDTLRFGDIVEFNKMLQNGKFITDTGLQRQKVSEKQATGIEQRSENRNSIGHIDILTGGFPCQPFSHAGKRKGTDDSRYLWPEMLTTIRILKPSFVVGENVAGLVSMENGKTLDRILSDLANEGYTTEQFIIPACAVGAWHRRDRIWIIGINTNHNTIRCDNGEYAIEKGSKRRGESFNRHEGLDKNVSDTQSKRCELCQRSEYEKFSAPEKPFLLCGSCQRYGGWWSVEPPVGRVVNGIPNRVDRLKGLGNAIVPQVAFEIFKAIELLITSGFSVCGVMCGYMVTSLNSGQG